MCGLTNSGKSASFVQSPSSLVQKQIHHEEIIQISQEERELLKAGYDIYHISAHRETQVLVVDTGNNNIVENEGDITLNQIPCNLDELKIILSTSELSDATVTQLTLNWIKEDFIYGT